MLVLRSSRVSGLCRVLSTCQLKQVRKILSQSYDCTEAWASWKDNSFCKDLQSYEFIPGVQKKYIGGGSASAVDIDIVASLMSDSDQVKDVKDLLYKLRHTPETCQTLSSTHHAVVRNFLRLGKSEELLEMLADTVNFGIFPDSFSANLLMDHFLKQNNYKDATKVASHLMLQEEFSNRLSCLLSTYTSFMFLKTTDLSTAPTEETQTSADDEDDEVLFKVPWLKNPYFDDHFDLSDSRQLAGKTLLWMSKGVGDSPLLPSLQLVGLSAYEKFDRVSQLLKTADGAFHTEAIELASSLLTLHKGTSDTSEGEALKNESSKDLAAIEIQLSNATPSDGLSSVNLEQSIINLIQLQLPSLEKSDVESQQKLFAEWNKRREQQLNNQIHRVLKREQLKAFEQQRKELAAEEEVMFFFERKDELEKQMHTSVKAMETEQRKRMATGELPPDDEYVIPDITARQLPKTQDHQF